MSRRGKVTLTMVTVVVAALRAHLLARALSRIRTHGPAAAHTAASSSSSSSSTTTTTAGEPGKLQGGAAAAESSSSDGMTSASGCLRSGESTAATAATTSSAMIEGLDALRVDGRFAADVASTSGKGVVVEGSVLLLRGGDVVTASSPAAPTANAATGAAVDLRLEVAKSRLDLTLLAALLLVLALELFLVALQALHLLLCSGVMSHGRRCQRLERQKASRHDSDSRAWIIFLSK